jgi:hypothetical protein
LKNQNTKSVPPIIPAPIWVYADKDNHTVYLNPTLSKGNVLKITSSGVSLVEACPDIRKTPKAYAPNCPVTFIPMNESGIAAALHYVHEFVMPQLPLEPANRVFATAWALSLPLIEWMDDYVHISLVCNTKKPALRVQHKLAVLLLGESISATKLPLTDNVKNASFPIFLNTSFDSEYNLQLSRPSIAIDTGRTRFLQSTAHLNIVSIQANDALSDAHRYTMTDDSIHMMRSHILSAHACLISKMLRMVEDDIAAISNGVGGRSEVLEEGKQTVSHAKVIQLISDEIKAAEKTKTN